MANQITINLPEELSEVRDDLRVFVEGMVRKLFENRHKGKWEDLNTQTAMDAMLSEVDELYDALSAGVSNEAFDEAVDVANFALILSNMALTGRDNPFASRAKTGKALDFVKWASEQNVDHCILWPYRSKTGPNQEYGSLSKGSSEYGRRAHRVACGLRHGPPPSSEHHAEHLCGNPLCVNPRHLRWSTPQENQLRKREHGTASTPQKLSKEIADNIRAVYKMGASVQALAAEHGVSDTNIYNILNGKAYT